MDTNGKITAEELELINALSRRSLSEDEIYTFPVTLCDNETDRDYERFSVAALEGLSEMFVGKTGIFDHNPSGRNQTARIYKTELLRDEGRRTRSGEVYTYIKGYAYMMNTSTNADLIEEIEGGIKKEVSVCCSVKRRVCSICGKDQSSGCSHIKGEYYAGSLCEIILDEAADAYEWSFVAVPAQPNAGITKSFKENGREEMSFKALKRQLSDRKRQISIAKADILTEIVRLGQFCVPAYRADTIKALCENMSIEQLLDFKEKTRGQVRIETLKSTLRRENDDDDEQADELDGFKM